MTEKSEDQAYLQSRHQPASEVISSLQLENRQLKSDLALAVGALEKVIAQGEHGNELSLISSDFGIALDRCIKIAKEALGKIGEKDAK